MTEHELSSKEVQTLLFIRNTLAHGMKSPSIRDIQEKLGYKSPRSAAVIVEALISKKRITRRADGTLQILKDLSGNKANAQTVTIPLVGSAACGRPLLAEENIEAFIPVSTELARPGHKYFLLRARGDSMNLAGIEDGSIVLVRQQNTADNGNIIVALIDDEATIKEFRKTTSAILLIPRSTSSEHSPIILTKDFRIQGKIITTIAGLELETPPEKGL